MGNTKNCQDKNWGDFFYTKIVLCYEKIVTNLFSWQKILMTEKNLLAKQTYDKQNFLTKNFITKKMCTNFMTKVLG